MSHSVSRFWAGFAVATVLWVAATGYLYYVLGYGPPEEIPVAVNEEPAERQAPAPEEDAPARRRHRRRRGAARADRGSTPMGNATTGGDLGDDEEMRTIDMGGAAGEQQLTGAQIEAGFDTAMGGIRRCLVLMAGESDVRGRVTFGLRVEGSGRVSRVSLSGPRAATTGEAGECLQRTARQIRFDSFDGPEMVIRYPLTLE
jgi:hypothetical protein